MSNDIATISLRVNTGELERGNQELDRFQRTATGAAEKADDLNSTFRTGIDNQKKNTESLKQQRQELQSLLNKISPVNKALDELDTIQESLSKFRGKGMVANQDGLITALCIQFDDLAQAKVIIHDTFSHYLDARNFPDGNPTADPQQETRQLWYIDRRSAESDTQVEFELSSPVDLRGRVIPTRQIHSLCTWCSRGWYRTGKGCDYAGTNYFDEDGNRVDDPSRDVCGGLLSDCKKRFGSNEPLPFGGFPGSALIRG